MAFSYQHEYHAGNHADVLKHTALVLILESLCKKSKPFTLIDSHSGAGVFSLNDERLLKTGEAEGGIKRITALNTKHNSPLPHGISLYLETQSPFLNRGLYAGSPALENAFLREQDVLHLVEKHPQALLSLKANTAAFESKGKIHIHEEDSYKALNALTPPVVKRGLILCDPSYEDAEDYKRVTDTLIQVHKKWNTAVIALWYPLITRRKNETAQMLVALEDAAKLGLNPTDSFRSELIVKDPRELTEENGSHLYGSGMFIMNPPWQLKEQLEESRLFLEKVLK